MRKLVVAGVAFSLFVGAYALWPVMAAFQIKQAVKSGDVATLERKVQWPAVRASLKASIAQLSHPGAASAEPQPAHHGLGIFSLWSRVKAAAAPMVADTFIDTYVTAQGVTQLHKARKGGWRSMLGLQPKPSDRGPTAALSVALQGAEPHTDAAGEEPGVVSRFIDFYRHLVRAKFHSLSLVEFEIADRSVPARSYVSRFELANFEWTLASVRVVGVAF